MKMKKGLIIGTLINKIINARIAYNNIKKDEELRKNYTRFGRVSLLYTFLFALLTVGGLTLMAVCIKNMVYAMFLYVIGLIVSIYISGYGLVFVPLSLNLLIKQLCTNKKPIGYVALVMFIIVLIAAVVALVFVFNTIFVR